MAALRSVSALPFSVPTQVSIPPTGSLFSPVMPISGFFLENLLRDSFQEGDFVLCLSTMARRLSGTVSRHLLRVVSLDMLGNPGF